MLGVGRPVCSTQVEMGQYPCVRAGVTPRAEVGSWGTSLLDMLTTWDEVTGPPGKSLFIFFNPFPSWYRCLKTLYYVAKYVSLAHSKLVKK